MTHARTAAPAIVLLGLVSVLGPIRIYAQDVEGAEDHPLLSRIPGSRIVNYEQKEFDEITVPLGPAETENRFRDARTVEGNSTWIAYRMPPDRSALEVVRSYRAALEDEGFEALYECHTDRECGVWFDRAFRRVVDDGRWAFSSEAIDEDGQEYLALRRQGPESETYVLIYAYPAYSTDFVVARLRIVEIGEMEGRLVTADADALARDIERTGHAAVYGIYFDTDRATIKPESRQTLDAIAELLGARPDLSVYVVGHTDMTGSLEHNMDLARRRAESVVEALVADYGIDPSRLTAQGVGPLAPVASNESEEGRARNRRVDLVAKLEN